MMTRNALILLSVLAAGPALAADSPYSFEARTAATSIPVHLPPCSNSGVLRTIASAFQDKESEFWNSDLTLTSFDEPVELGTQPWGLEFIPRRFCQARTMVSDGTVHEVYYSVGHQTGTLGIVHGVEWCVTGFDRNLAYAPGCRMAAP